MRSASNPIITNTKNGNSTINHNNYGNGNDDNHKSKECNNRYKLNHAIPTASDNQQLNNIRNNNKPIMKDMDIRKSSSVSANSSHTHGSEHTNA